MTVKIICECEKVHEVKVREVPCMITFVCKECKTSRLIPLQ